MGTAGWLSSDDFARARAWVPLPCVDVLVWRGPKKRREIGLITRRSPDGSDRYALVGGRVLKGETLDEALQRHVRDTLGPRVVVGDVDPSRPHRAFEYFPDRRGPLVDPEKHAIALTYVARISGEVELGGEATGFRWFETEAVPSPEAFGFGHGLVVRALLEALR